MKLRNKVLLAIGLAWGFLFLLTFAGSWLFLRQSFLQLEHNQVNRNLERVEQALDQVNYALGTFTDDWAHWNAAYDFLKGTNPSFTTANLNMEAYVNSHINFLIYFNNETDKIAVGIAADTDHEKLIPYQAGLFEKYLFSKSKLRLNTNVEEDIRGLIALPSGIMLVASVAVTNGNKTLAPIGTLVTGSNFSPALIDKLADMTKLSVHLYLPQEIYNNQFLTQTYQQIIGSKQYVAHPEDENNISGYTVLHDINGDPIGMLTIKMPRSIYQSGNKAIGYYLTSFLGLGIFLTGILWWLLRKLVLVRLERLNDQIKHIAKVKDLSKRVDVDGNDELASVSNEVNAMITIIQTSHEQLEEHVIQRTKELADTNTKLHREINERKFIEVELVKNREELMRLAHYDNLTSLPNRILFNEMLAKSISFAQRHHKQLAVLFIDLDRFKNINDGLGHHMGDKVLKEIATRFEKSLRSEDVVARLGGDEFIVMLRDIENVNIAAQVAEKLLQSSQQPVIIDKHEFFIDSSIGICIYPQDGQNLEDLQKNADMAMYKAKHHGGGTYNFYTEEMDREVQTLINTEANLRRALDNNELILHYQPKINLKNGALMGVEALLRWYHPEKGIISPINFIPIAEETGLIMNIGEWVLREACKINKEWQDKEYRPMLMSVNLSARQFAHANLEQLVKEVLAEIGLAPQYLELEITESVLMTNIDAAIEKLKAIQALGVKIAIDDFGTGYSSISYLKHLPINVLKIDQAFVKGIPDNRDDMAITSAVIALAHNLDLCVVAEGIENREQLDYLVKHQCDIGQGYYFSRPIPEDKLLLEMGLETPSASI